MLIREMFSKPIDRDIKGVIKVGQDDDSNVRQELEEYVVTRELQKHFADFFSSYNCSYSIYYSISYSFEEFYQSHDRIYRYGQSLPCTYLFLQAEHTIDQAMYRCVMDKKSNTELYETILKDIAKRHTHLK